MAMRTVCIQMPASVCVEQKSLIIESFKGKMKIPLEDIWVLIFESHEITLTSASLAAINDAGIGVMTCGKDHMPNGLLLPLGAHSRHSAIVEDQLAISKPLAKQLWKKIIVAKINNQAQVLDLLGISGSDKLREYASDVKSGDTTGREATAAAFYFNHLIEKGTRRESKATPCLDYGYAIVRAGIAREAVGGGWLVSRGIHHCSNLNAFNLVDDFIEPFRPLVDLLVFKEAVEYGLDTQSKQTLAGVFGYYVVMDGKKYTAQSAITLVLDSFKRAVLNNNADELILPEVIPLTTYVGADQ